VANGADYFGTMVRAPMLSQSRIRRSCRNQAFKAAARHGFHRLDQLPGILLGITFDKGHRIPRLCLGNRMQVR